MGRRRDEEKVGNKLRGYLADREVSIEAMDDGQGSMGSSPAVHTN
jgi:hypothetical protein